MSDIKIKLNIGGSALIGLFFYLYFVFLDVFILLIIGISCFIIYLLRGANLTIQKDIIESIYA